MGGGGERSREVFQKQIKKPTQPKQTRYILIATFVSCSDQLFTALWKQKESNNYQKLWKCMVLLILISSTRHSIADRYTHQWFNQRVLGLTALLFLCLEPWNHLGKIRLGWSTKSLPYSCLFVLLPLMQWSQKREWVRVISLSGPLPNKNHFPQLAV